MRDFSSSRLATALGSSVGSSPRSELLHCPAEAMRAEMLIDRSSDILYEEAVNDIDRDVYTCTAPWSASPPPHHDRTRTVMSRAVSDDAHHPLSQFLGYRSPTRGSIDRYASSDGVSLSSAVGSGPSWKCGPVGGKCGRMQSGGSGRRADHLGSPAGVLPAHSRCATRRTGRDCVSGVLTSL